VAIDPAAIGRLVEDIGDELVEWRRRLHLNPELSFEEVETSRFVYETLESFGAGLELSRPTETSVLARLVGENPGRTIAIRADMDALPVQEETGLPFASENEGVAHACGHDGHIAILLGTAKVLGELREHVNGEVRFVF
jgi:amidohydrolase